MQSDQLPADPTVSVIIPTYNRADWLPACIESARLSGTRGLEIILVDDGSTDSTREVVKKLGHDIQYFYQEHAGEAAARNNGIHHSRGRYVAFLDSDDQWLPGGHQRLVEFMDQHPDVRVGFADAKLGNRHEGYRSLVRESAQDRFRQLPARAESGGFRVLERQALFRSLARRIGLSICTVVVRRATLQATGGFDEDLTHGADWELWLRLATQSTFVYYDRYLATYERHAGNVSHSSDRDFALGQLATVVAKILDRNPPLPGKDRACLQAGLADRLQDWGYLAFDRGDFVTARERFAACVKVGGARPRALFYWLSTWLRRSDVQRLRELKWRAQAVHFRRRHAGSRS